MGRDRCLQVRPELCPTLSGAQPEQPPGFSAPSGGLYKQGAKSGKKSRLRVIVQEEILGRKVLILGQ